MTTQITKPIPEISDKTEALIAPGHHSNISMSVGDFHTVGTRRPQKVILPSGKSEGKSTADNPELSCH